MPIALLVLVGSCAAFTDERTLVPPCSAAARVPVPPGEVVRLFELHKNHNPQNVLIVYTYADPDCRVIGGSQAKQQLVDMYWRMKTRSPDECYKPTHALIKRETLDGLQVTDVSADRRRFRMDITLLDELAHDLPTREAEIVLKRGRSGCQSEVRIPLEPGGAATLRLQAINATGESHFGVPRRGVKQLELVGLDDHDRRIRRVYHSN